MWQRQECSNPLLNDVKSSLNQHFSSPQFVFPLSLLSSFSLARCSFLHWSLFFFLCLFSPQWVPHVSCHVRSSSLSPQQIHKHITCEPELGGDPDWCMFAFSFLLFTLPLSPSFLMSSFPEFTRLARRPSTEPHLCSILHRGYASALTSCGAGHMPEENHTPHKALSQVQHS